MKKLRGKYDQIDEIIENLRQEVANLNKEFALGRGNQAWLTNEKNRVTKAAQDKIKEARSSIQMDLILQKAAVNDLVQPSDRYNERAYHVQVAQALTQDKKPEELIATFKKLDREQMKHKSEYMRVFGSKIDSDHSIDWQQAVDAVRTPEEQERDQLLKEVNEYEGFLGTLDAHIENRVVKAMTGEEVSPHDVPAASIFDEVSQTVDERTKA